MFLFVFKIYCVFLWHTYDRLVLARFMPILYKGIIWMLLMTMRGSRIILYYWTFMPAVQ